MQDPGPAPPRPGVAGRIAPSQPLGYQSLAPEGRGLRFPQNRKSWGPVEGLVVRGAETSTPHQLRLGQKAGLGFCRARRDPEETEGQGDPGLCREGSEDALVLLSSGFLTSEKPEDSSSEKDAGQSERPPLIKAAT